jgi:antitoxin HicB
MTYYALFEPAEEGGYVITFPDLNRGATQGDSESDALSMAADFLECIVYLYIRAGEPLPAPKVWRGKKYRAIRLSALASMKAELYRAFIASGMKKSELARRLKISKGIVDRLFDVRLQTRLDQIEAALEVVGKRMTVEIHDTAA